MLHANLVVDEVLALGEGAGKLVALLQSAIGRLPTEVASANDAISIRCHELPEHMGSLSQMLFE